jgi:hypothetical protein
MSRSDVTLAAMPAGSDATNAPTTILSLTLPRCAAAFAIAPNALTRGVRQHACAPADAPCLRDVVRILSLIGFCIRSHFARPAKGKQLRRDAAPLRSRVQVRAKLLGLAGLGPVLIGLARRHDDASEKANGNPAGRKYPK